MSSRETLVASVVGARPNFVKLAPLSKALSQVCREIVVHTGQHYDYQMDRIFFDQLGIPKPSHHLGVGSGTHGAQTGAMLAGLEKVFIAEKPAVVLVFGDTNTTLSGALAAVKLNIPVVHVEAGLRSFNREMPEEINRLLVDHVSRILSCPTQTAVENLRREGITEGIYLTGDVMVDVMEDCLEIARHSSSILKELGLFPGGYHLATVHRAENTDRPSRLEAIVRALIDLTRDGPVIFPCHPRTRKRLESLGLWEALCNDVKVIEPVGYLNMLVLEGAAKAILTDSGGVQKEAYMLGVPCVTLRDETEWVETLQDGWNVLAGANADRIVELARDFRPLGERRSAFGDGQASQRIVESMGQIL